jgi:hypothetical protein
MKCEHDPCVQTRRHDGRWSGCVKDPGVYLNVMGLVLRRQLDHDHILCGGGDHEHGLLVDPKDIVQAGKARVADICQD